MRIQGYILDDPPGKDINIRDAAGAEITSADPVAILDFLLRPYPDTLKAVWDIDAFIAPVLRLLGLAICREIARTHEATFGDDGSGEVYSIFYITGKLMTIKKAPVGNQARLRATFYGLNGFFNDNEPEPASASALQEQGDRLLAELAEIGIVPTKLSSPISAFMSCRLLPRLSTIADTPDPYLGAQLYAEQCDGKEWREACKVGHWAFDECFSYDLSCAYGSVAARLPDLADAEYTFSAKMIDSACWGFLRGTVTIRDDVKISPIMTRIENGRLINPVGTFDGYVTLDEIRFIERYNIGSFKLKDGWFINFKHVTTPLAELMAEMYAYRARYKMLNNFLKRVPSGIVGMFRQHFQENGLGSLFNPIYHAVVTSTVRLKVAQLIYEDDAQSNVIRINTDGLLVDRPLWIRGSGMGKWRQVESQSTIVLSPELVFQGSKHPNGMTYGSLRVNICQHPKTSVYEDHTVQRRVTLFEAVRDNQLKMLGKSTPRAARVDLMLLAGSQTRNFPTFPRNGQQLIDGKFNSTPIKL